MKISFRKKEDENKFKNFVCENKKVLRAFFAFGSAIRNPFAKGLFFLFSKVLGVICPD